MGSSQQHRQKSERNQEFVDQILGLGFHEWTAIAIFYKAVHLVEMMFAQSGVHSQTHQERNESLRDNHPDLYREFHPLFNFSLMARYDCTGDVTINELRMLMTRSNNLEDAIEAAVAGRP